SQSVPAEQTALRILFVLDELTAHNQIALFIERNDHRGTVWSERLEREIEVEDPHPEHDPFVLRVQFAQINNGGMLTRGKLTYLSGVLQLVIELPETKSATLNVLLRTQLRLRST